MQLFVVSIVCSRSRACSEPSSAKVVEEQKSLRVATAVDVGTPTATSFSSEVPKLYALSIGEHLTTGEVWIAEDVEAAAPQNSKIDEEENETDSA